MWALIFGGAYLVASVVCVLLSGAGHGPGIAALYIVSLPTALLAQFCPGGEIMMWVAVLGLVQWVLIGVFFGAWARRKKAKRPKS